MRRVGWVTVSALVVTLAAIGASWAVTGRGADTRPALTSAMAAVPASTTVLGFTDWERVRAVGSMDPGARDLTTRSVLEDLGAALPDALGWSTREVAWEAYAQDNQAGTLVVRAADSLGVRRLEGGLRDAGFQRSGDVWTADAQVQRETGLGDAFAAVQLVPSRGLLVAGTDPAAVGRVVDAATGQAAALTSVREATDTAAVLAGSGTVLLRAGTLACDATSVRDPADAPQVEAAQERFGTLEAYRYSGRALIDRGGGGDDAQTATFAWTFGSVGQARQQIEVRERFATGPFIGRTGQVEDQLRLRGTGVEQATASMAFERSADGTALMFGEGPLLFASC